MVPVTAKMNTEEPAAVHPAAAAINGELQSVALDVTDTQPGFTLNIFLCF